MMKYDNRRKVGSNYFFIFKLKIGLYSIDDYLSQFDIDDYWIIKQTNSFRFITKDELDKYAGFLLLKKSIYSKENIEKWLLFIKDNNINLRFLSKPFPPPYLLEKIKIIDIL